MTTPANLTIEISRSYRDEVVFTSWADAEAHVRTLSRGIFRMKVRATSPDGEGMGTITTWHTDKPLDLLEVTRGDIANTLLHHCTHDASRAYTRRNAETFGIDSTKSALEWAAFEFRH